MNGALALLKTAAAAGIEICFANPGTTETPLVVALDHMAGIKAVLGVFEGVCTGAADGYGRMKGSPAMTLLHLGPGFANGIANLHNARRAGTPLVNVIGEHATWHRPADAPLAMDIEALAGTVSGWYRTVRSPADVPGDMKNAISASLSGRIATLIVPHDYQSAEAGDHPPGKPVPSFAPIDEGLVDEAAALLTKGARSAIILGGPALLEEGLKLAGRIRALTGCDLLVGSFPARVDRGGSLPRLTKIPYFPELALKVLSPYESLILIGTVEPVTFFGYEGVDSYLIRKDQRKVSVASPGQDVMAALKTLADRLEAENRSGGFDEAREALRRPEVPAGTLTAERICLTLAALQPEGSIIVDEGLTTAFPYFALSPDLPRHSLLTIAGGSIGYGIPCATGAALACRERPVIDFQADGSGLYTVQGLWTQAREGLDVTTLLCSNRSYHIVRIELERAGVTVPGPNSRNLTDLGHPAIDWVKISEGFGVPAAKVDTVSGLARELTRAVKEAGPHLIEIEMEPPSK